jgi:hypothetical protein
MGCAVSGEEEAGFFGLGRRRLEIAERGKGPEEGGAGAGPSPGLCECLSGQTGFDAVLSEAWADRLVERRAGTRPGFVGKRRDPDPAESARVFNDEALSLVLTAAFLSGRPAPELREALPDFCIERKEAYCSAEGKGKVMRLFSAGDSGRRGRGVRIRRRKAHRHHPPLHRPSARLRPGLKARSRPSSATLRRKNTVS